MIAETLLPKLSDWQPSSPGPHSLSIPVTDGWELIVAADQADSLGCRVTELSMTRPATAEPPEALREWAKRSARLITGLLEPLAVIEIDSPRREAVLRSERPSVRGNRLAYYELLLRGHHSAKLRRYEGDRAGSRRRSVPFALTHESIAKLAEDLLVD